VAAIVVDETPALFDVPNHIWMAMQTVAILVYPASAGFIGKMANGLAIDVASTTLLAAYGIPTMVAPSMNPQMWKNPLVQRNIKTLEENGLRIAHTDDGIAPAVDSLCRDFMDFLQHQPVG